MANGGHDNCLTCGFNRANSGQWGFPPEEDLEAWTRPGHCTIRQTDIPNPLMTFCANYRTRETAPRGEIYSEGLTEEACTYPRIPWHAGQGPRMKDSAGQCGVCGRSFTRGIRLALRDGSTLRFCCNAHYLKWWRQQHPGEVLAYDYSMMKDPDQSASAP